MDFIINNIVWFIVGGVVILMTIIGYLADKTDFASKKYREKMLVQESEKKEKKKEKKSKKEKHNDDVLEMNIGNEQTNPVVEEQNDQLLDPLYNPTIDNSSNEVEANDIPEELFAPLDSNIDSNTLQQDKVSEPAENFSLDSSVEELPSTNDNNSFIMPVENTEESPKQNEDFLSIDSPVVETLSQNESGDQSAQQMIPQVDVPLVNEEILSTSEQSAEVLNESLPDQAVETVSDDQFNKIFPDDPVVIGEGHKENAEVNDTVLPQAVAPEQEVEDVWKF